MLSFFYLFKLLQTDFTIRERRDKKYAKPRCVVDISLVGRRRKQRVVVCRDERDERERDCVARLFVCARLILMRRALYWICPRYVILFGHFSKRETKKSLTFHRWQKKKKRRKIWTLFSSSFPDLSSFFKEDTFIIALLLLLLLLQREKERKREERERDKVRKFESEYRDDHFKTTL